MRVFKRGSLYYMDYVDASGTRRRESTKTNNKKIADRIASKKELEVLEQTKLGITPIKPVLLSKFIKEYLEISKANKVNSTYTIDKIALEKLVEIITDRNLHEIREEHIEKYKAERLNQKAKNSERNISNTTVNKELSTIKNMLKMALRRGLIRKDPSEYVKKPQEPPGRVRYLTKDEMPRLLEACKKHSYLYLFVVIALNTGMRKSEILNLSWLDIDFDHNLIHLDQTKNRERADILLNKVVVSELRKYRKEQQELCQEKGTGFPGQVFPYSDVKKSFTKALETADIPNFRIHDLRHTFASYLVMNNVPLPVVKDLMRHKSFDMTLRYAHLSPTQKKDAVELIAEIWRESGKKTDRKKIKRK
jgi:integrase